MGLGSAALFGLNAIFVKIGMRRQPIDNGHFMSVLVNVLFLGVLMLFVSLPRWNMMGVVGFVLAGLLTTWMGRGTSFMAIRLLGPPRQGAILVSAPLFAAIAGWFFLGEGITLLQALGGAIISIGILVLLRSRVERRTPAAVEPEVDEATLAIGDGPSTQTRATRIGTAIRQDQFTRGFLIAVMSAVFFGSGFVARKWGLSYVPSAAGGAFIGACTALSMIILGSAVRGRLGRLADDNLRGIPWWFVAGGTASSIALFLQFSAFDYLPAWVVSLLQGTQALWTLLWTWLFLRDEEQIGSELVLSISLVVVGVAIMTYGL
jgi:drug/metabolite transporter (DMT)-like permease